MAIPGRNLERLESRAKVKVGEKRGGRPASVDYFICPDAEFAQLAGEQPKQLRITLPYRTAEENFGTGLERWLSKRGGGQLLTCYTKDDGPRPVALRLTDHVREADEVRGEARGQRTPITCGADACPFFKDRTCKPMGRLVFFLEGGRQDAPLQMDTKGWNTIEELSKELTAAERRNPDLRGRVFVLSVAFQKTAAGRFPVVSIKEDIIPINDEADIALADLCVAGQAAVEAGEEQGMKVALARLLDAFRPGWRDDTAYIDRIKEVGAQAALVATIDRATDRLG